MTSLQSDIVGRVNRLPLRPTERTALLPLLEAVSNSVDSIQERFKADAVKKGQISVRVIRNENEQDMPVIGFDVEDNGIGFTPANFKSFQTPDSRKKESAGGKGVGRLAWLKIFRSISVDSTYLEDGDLYRRRFNFRLSENDQIEDLVSEPEGSDVRTIISFRFFDGAFAGRCPSKPQTIVTRLLAHFVPLFVAGNAPKILVHDVEITDIQTEFTDNIISQQTDTLDVEVGGAKIDLQLWSLKCTKKVRFDAGGYNFAFLTANNRSVLDYCLDDQLGLKALEDEFVYVGCAYGEFLDKHVNAERTAFTVDGGDLEAIKRAIARRAREFLSNYIEEALVQKVEVTKEVIAENPQFMFEHSDLKDFARKLQPNTFKKEDIFVELSRSRFRRQRTLSAMERDIDKATSIDEEIEKKIEEYRTQITADTKGALAEYVMRRKSVLDLFEKFLGYKAEELAYEREDAIHGLICPMRVDSTEIDVSDHNLWLLDDRLAFSSFFASDLELRKISGVDSDERPDLAFFYDNVAAWRETEHSDTVIIVEFKRPMREDYSKGKDPVQQVLTYVKRLQEETGMTDRKGRAIRGINAGTAFHCYIVVDLTPQLEDRIIGRLLKTPDGQGYFGYQTNPNAYVEIIPYGKLLNDARLRNAIFFQKLGITASV